MSILKKFWEGNYRFICGIIKKILPPQNLNEIIRETLAKIIERTTEFTRRRHGFFGDRWMVTQEGMDE